MSTGKIALVMDYGLAYKLNSILIPGLFFKNIFQVH
jgi:hypothetical protein